MKMSLRSTSGCGQLDSIVLHAYYATCINNVDVCVYQTRISCCYFAVNCTRTVLVIIKLTEGRGSTYIENLAKKDIRIFFTEYSFIHVCVLHESDNK